MFINKAGDLFSRRAGKEEETDVLFRELCFYFLQPLYHESIVSDGGM